MLLQVARHEVGHGGAAIRDGGKRRGQRLLAGPDARDDERRPPAGLYGVEHVVAADRHEPEQLLSRPFPRLSDVDLAARRVDPVLLFGTLRDDTNCADILRTTF